MNPFLAHLGFNAQDRVLILHADDVGLCHASVSAFADLLDGGFVSSGSVMVPSPWFPAVASLCRMYPNVDMGVHVTLTAEWDHYRWGPLTYEVSRRQLLDADGYFPRTIQQLWQQADVETVFQEVNAQLNQALAAGIVITHLDDHMGALTPPSWFARWIDLALSHRLPIRFERPNSSDTATGTWADANAHSLRQAEASGLPLFDHCIGLETGNFATKLQQIEHTYAELPPGSLSIIFAHPAKDSPELRAITTDSANRAADFEILSSEALRVSLQRAGIHVIGFEPLHQAILATSRIKTDHL